jgi:hypothetical protein
MTDPTPSGLLFIVMSVIAVVILGLALAYGTSRWNTRRKMRAPGTVESAPGPAPRNSVSGSDDVRAR